MAGNTNPNTELILLKQRVAAVELLLIVLIESISAAEAVTPSRTVTNVFYELLEAWADTSGPDRGVAMLARILVGHLNAKNNVTSKRRRSKKR